MAVSIQDFNALITHAATSKLISRPHLVPGAKGQPFFTATCAVELSDGAQSPNNPMGRRVASGRSVDAADAQVLAMLEAVERYSQQYSNSRPDELIPFLTVNGADDPVAQDKITLGAPTTNGQVTSAGTAAGRSLPDAAGRAVLEALEHHYLARLSGPNGLALSSHDEEATLSDCKRWLEGQMRHLSCYLHTGADHVFALCECRDADGGRPTRGSAAAHDPATALLSAAQEAIAHWRNMVALEHNAVPRDQFSGAELDALLTYRGTVPLHPPTATPTVRGTVLADSPATPDRLADTLAQLSGLRVRLVDLTVPEIGIPVVRVALG